MQQFDRRKPTEPTVPIQEYFHLFWSWAWLILLCGALAGAAAYVVSIRTTPIFQASTRILVSAPSTIGGVDPSALVTTQTMIETYSQMLLDQPVLQGVIDQLKLGTTPDDLKKSITVDIVANTQLVVITAEDPDPARSADVANAVASVFATRIRELQSLRYSASREGLSTQVSDMEQQIATTNNQIGAIEQRMAAAATQAAVAASQTAEAATQIAAGATQTAVAASQTAEAATQTAASVTQTLSAVIAGPAATQQIAASQTSEAATQTAAVASNQTPAVASTGPAPAQQVVGVPNAADASAVEQLQARLTQYRTIYSDLVTSFEQVRLSEEQTSTNVVITEPATVPSVAVRPKTTQNTVLAVLGALLLAMVAVFAMDALDDTIKNPNEIRRKFNIPILGMIAWHEAPQDSPIALSQPRSPTAEAFRSLRTNITYAAVDKPLRRLMITSPTPEDGKTTVACSLAAVLAQGEKRVVLIDADMRRPHVHRKFGLPNRLGLSDLFVQTLDSVDSVLHAAAPNLAVLTSGGLPPNASELLTSKMMGQILDKLSLGCDVIIVDTPPVLTVTDAAALAPDMDGVVLVAKPGTTKLVALQQALEQLRAVDARVLGVVLNEVNPGSRKYGYYYHPSYSKY